MAPYDRVVTFSAAKHNDRMLLDERITSWVTLYNGVVVGQVVRQTSDASYHCLSIILFCKDA